MCNCNTFFLRYGFAEHVDEEANSTPWTYPVEKRPHPIVKLVNLQHKSPSFGSYAWQASTCNVVVFSEDSRITKTQPYPVYSIKNLTTRLQSPLTRMRITDVSAEANLHDITTIYAVAWLYWPFLRRALSHQRGHICRLSFA
ncbi:unnamed protein product [Amoebophrya sp. A120]|nr:unnamed protein product [Amoebophrya sp. A120]|eukprot:GSA120T00013277001.1